MMISILTAIPYVDLLASFTVLRAQNDTMLYSFSSDCHSGHNNSTIDTMSWPERDLLNKLGPLFSWRYISSLMYGI